MSKGNTPRPYSVDLNTFDNNWDNIFRKPQVDDDKQPPPGTSRIEPFTSSTFNIDTYKNDRD